MLGKRFDDQKYAMNFLLYGRKCHNKQPKSQYSQVYHKVPHKITKRPWMVEEYYCKKHQIFKT